MEGTVVQKPIHPIEKNRSSSVTRYGPLFSYMSLLPQDGSFPHRTQPIGDPQTQKRDSIGGGSNMSRTNSNEYLNQTGKRISWLGVIRLDLLNHL